MLSLAAMHELLGLAYSPWTEKARWALDARRVPYTFRHYQPLLGEPALRAKVRRLVGRVSVPVLTTDDGRVLEDSAAIARFAALSERALAAGRDDLHRALRTPA